MAEAHSTTETFRRLWAEVKAHPYVAAGAVFIVGAVLVYAYYSGGSTTATGSTAATDTSNYLQAQLASEAQNAQLSAQLSAQQTQAQSVATQVNGAVDIAQIQANASSAAVSQSGTLGLAQIAAQQTVDLANIAANQSIALGSIAATVGLGSIQAAAQLGQTQLITDFLNNEVSNQYGYLNNLVNTSAQVQLANLLNSGEVAQIEGQINSLGQTVGAGLTAEAASNSALYGAVTNLYASDHALYQSLFGPTPPAITQTPTAAVGAAA